MRSNEVDFLSWKESATNGENCNFSYSVYRLENLTIYFTEYMCCKYVPFVLEAPRASALSG